MRTSFTYSAQPCDVACGMVSKRTLTTYVTGESDLLSRALRCVILALSASVGSAATTSTARAIGGVGDCMIKTSRAGGTSVGYLHVANVDRAGRPPIEQENDRPKVGQVHAEFDESLQREPQCLHH